MSAAAGPDRRRHERAALTIGALGVVYGNIGTSPLYAIRACFFGESPIAPTPANVLGVLSLIVWALVLVVSVKYLFFVLRADNKGQGGMLALLALLRPEGGPERRDRKVIVALALFGSAILFGDGMIAPAVSVLSAVEGLEVATPVFEPFVIPITLGVLVGLFVAQRRGTRRVATIFGPIMLVWFIVLALLGATTVAHRPGVFTALNPMHGVEFFARNGWHGLLVLGAVFLVVTGGEALYADMGHFGRRPVRVGWFLIVLPALVLNYFGQGALLLVDPGAGTNPFYGMAPDWALYPLVGLATAAAVIASQAIISAAFSLTRQAVQLGYVPRLEIVHTSRRRKSQIYVPAANRAGVVATVGLVLGFQSSDALAAAFGVGITTGMIITTVLMVAVMFEAWRWNVWLVALFAAAFLAIDGAFLVANYTKVPDGGWFPLVAALALFTLMTTWKRGREILAERRVETSLPTELFLLDVAAGNVARVPGTAVFLYEESDNVPPALLHNIKHNKVLHEYVVLLTIETTDAPQVDTEDRIDVEPLGSGVFRIIGRYGFMEDPNVPELLEEVDIDGLDFAPMDTTYFFSGGTLLATDRPGMAIWREYIFALMWRNAHRASQFFRLPPNRVVELGSHIEL